MTENTLPKPCHPQPHEPPQWGDRFHSYPVLGPSRALAAAPRVWTNSEGKPLRPPANRPPNGAGKNAPSPTCRQSTRCEGRVTRHPPLSPSPLPVPAGQTRKRVCPTLLSNGDAPSQPASNRVLPGNKAIAAYPVNPQVPPILVQTITSATSKLAQKKLEKTRSNTLKHAQTCSNLLKHAQICMERSTVLQIHHD